MDYSNGKKKNNGRRSAGSAKYEKGKRYSRKNSTKGQREDAEIIGTAEKNFERSKSNPYAWYAEFPNYAKDVATLPFGTPVGQAVYLNPTDYVANAGIMALLFTPTPGLSTDMTSPINRQAVRFQTYLRSVMRADSSYDAADTMMYMMGIDSLYTFWAYMRRAYGVAQLFTPTNKYLPNRLLQAMGIDPAIAGNLADFRAYINRFALNIGRFALPKDFDIVARHMWMCSGLYTDSESNRAQIYLFVPNYLYVWNNTVTTGSELSGIPILANATTPTSYNLQDLVQIGDQLINNFNNDDDTMRISGDIYRAYGAEGCLKVEETVDNYAVLPVYDKTVLSQIENATFVGEFVTDGGEAVVPPVISQDPSVNNGAILFNPTFSNGPTNVGSTHMGNWISCQPSQSLNMHWDSPTPEQIMEATRLTSSLDISSHANFAHLKAKSLPADVINGVNVWVTSLTNPSAVQFINIKTQTVWFNPTTGLIYNPTGLDAVVILQQFDWAPMFYEVATDDAASTTNLRLVAADVDNFTTVSNNQLLNMHEAALLSLLNIKEPARI